jgi:hypothetical protein
MLRAMNAERFFLELAAVLASPHSDRAALNAFGAPWSGTGQRLAAKLRVPKVI